MPQRDSIELIRLEAALPLVKGKGAGFKTAAEETPFLLRSLGLGAGLSVLIAKGDDRAELGGMIAEWLLHKCPHRPYPGATGRDVPAAIAAITAGTRAQYRAAQVEALGFATAIKRLAQALCAKGTDDA